jgi:signal transduction histidine kinase
MIQLPENSGRLLSRQISKSFPDGAYTEEGFQKFISLVNDAYISDKENRKLVNAIERIANRELENVNKELQLKNDFLDTFNHGMAHDIKNHTSNIIGLASMLKKYHARKDEKMLDTIIEKMDLSANQLTAIVQGFLYLSRAEANIDNQFVVIDEDEIKNSIKSETLFLTVNKHCTINYHFELNNLFFSFHVLKIIFVNLISNSIKFSKKNEAVVINVSLIHSNEAVVLTVEDNGIGMNLNDSNNKIFELFNRTGNTKLIKGTGVGLFMIKKIIERHQGKVEVKSELNQGTCFVISFPLNQTL